MKTISLFAIALISTTLPLMADDNKPMDGQQPAEACPPDPKSACALPSQAEVTGDFPIQRTEEAWRDLLTADQYRVMREHGTEPPFRNQYWDNKEPGIYVLAGTDIPLFSSKHKYKSGTGWPSFWDTIAPENIGQTVDRSYGMVRVEVHCSQDGSHLGHVFEDGPNPTGLRYCINSASLDFVPADQLEARGLGAYSNQI